jgi:DNA-binding MarR family transcriptional regulator
VTSRSGLARKAAAAIPRGDDIGHLLKQLGNVFRRRMDERLRMRELALSTAHMVVLFELDDNPGQAGAQLARRAMITAQAMNNVVHRLEADGLIERHAHPRNRRTDCWNLTAAGRRRLARAQAAAHPLMQKMLADLSAAERRELQRLLRSCIQALEIS